MIRSYQSEDEKSVIDLWMACNLVVPHNNPERDIERKLKVNPEWFLVGELEGVVVASCMAGYEGHRGWINYLAVSPEHQRKGFATLMMSEAEEQLRAAGCPKINLQIRETNKEVILFYESIGFSGLALHDPFAMACAIDESLAVFGEYFVAVETQGELTRGKTVVDTLGVSGKKPNTRVAIDLDREGFIAMMSDLLTSYE